MVGRQMFNALFIILLPLLTSGQYLESCADTTISDFWHESTQTCGIDVRNALEIYTKVLKYKQNADQFDELLKHEIRSTLEEVVVQQIIETVINKTLATNNNSGIFEEELLYKTDRLLTRAVWEKALHELYHSHDIDIADIVEQILSLNNGRLKFSIMEYYWRHYEQEFKNNPKFLPTLTYALSTLVHNSPAMSTTQQAIKADVMLKSLPQQLLNVFHLWNCNVSLWNHRHGEYMFADADRGPTSQQRYIFTYINNPPRFNVKGKFKIHFNTQGMVAFAINQGGATKFLKSTNDSVYYNLNDVLSSPQWWRVLWPYEGLKENEDEQYVYFQHATNEKLLCATTQYDARRRLVQTLSVKDHIMVESCQWKVEQRNEC